MISGGKIFLLFLLSHSLGLSLPLAPTNDEFYEVPSNVSEYKAGDIIRWRPPPVQLRSIVFPLNVKNAWQLQIRSEDSLGNPTAVVTTIVEPYNADPTKLLSFQSFEDLPSLNCSPSYAVLFGASMATLPSQWEMTLMDIALSKNWYVVFADHQGPKSAFTAGLQLGKAVLNGIRAALSSKDLTGIDPDARVGMYGYSGGSIASGWAAQLQPDYAPEIGKNIVGNAFGGVMSNHTQTYVDNDRTSFTGLVVAMINGMVQGYEALRPVLEREIRKDRLCTFYESRSLCLGKTFELYSYDNLFHGLEPWFNLGFLQNPEVAAVLKNNTLALDRSLGVPKTPLYIHQALHDDVIRFNQAEEVYEKWCSWGAPSIEFAVSNYTGHVSEGLMGIGAAFAWLERRINGEEPVVGCTKTLRSTNALYRGADVATRQFLDTFVRAIFGQKVGEETKNYTESTLLSKLFVYALNGFFTVFGPLKREVARSKISSIPEKDLFHGFRDIVALWRLENIDPWAVLYGMEELNAEKSVLFEDTTAAVTTNVLHTEH